MIVGITGRNCSGKDSVAKYLETKHFTHISLSDFLRAELRKRKKEITRPNLIAIGNELREKFGHGILSLMVLEQLDPDKKYVISSIRNPAEAEVLQKRKNFILVWLETPAKERFKRMQARGKKEGDPKTFSEFAQVEREEEAKCGAGQQLQKIEKMSKAVITNTGSKELLYSKIDRFLKVYKPKLDKRPSWDEYFMAITRQVGKRGTCERGKVGAVIVKNKRLLSTGYAGAPTGLPHCSEVGCEMHSVTHPDGSQSKHCIRTTHAEQNAITQAARYGIPIEGATLYCKWEPCYTCAKMIINAGIKRIVCEKKYHSAQRSREVFRHAGVKLEVLYDEVEHYANQ